MRSLTAEATFNRVLAVDLCLRNLRLTVGVCSLSHFPARVVVVRAAVRGHECDALEVSPVTRFSVPN